MSDFNAVRITRTFTQTNAAPAEKVFPLLCPAREAEWLEGWQAKMIYSESGVAEEGCIFQTQNAGEPETTWVIARHDPQNYLIEFVTVTPASRVARIEIRLEDNNDGTTASHISYTFTALSEAGNRFLGGYGADAFKQKMEWWERSLNHFLTTGKQLKAHA